MLLCQQLQRLSTALNRMAGISARTCLNTSPSISIRPRLEILEDRTVPTNITYHGGPTIPHVQVDNIVTGQQPVDTTALMQALVRDYLPLLGPNYSIGAGTLRSAITANPLSGSTINDNMVQNLILQEINSGAVPPPDGNQLYFVFLAPGQTSPMGSYHSGFFAVRDSSGYHIVTNGQPSGGVLIPITYAVSVIDAAHPDQLPRWASHELAEAVTDPDGITGFYDDGLGGNGEVADIYALQNPFLLDGYNVAVLSGPQGQMIGTPLSTSPLHTPYFLGLFDAFFHGVVKTNVDGTTTITDNLFGLQLVSTYNTSGNLQSVTLLGLNVTFLFENNL
jgi:hypothetical protein